MIRTMIASLAFLSMTTANAKALIEIRTDYQCRALGHHFRVKFDDKSEYLVESRLAFNVKIDKDLLGEKSEATLEMIGHVAFKKFVDGADTIDNFDGYSQFLEMAKDSSLSPRATKYTDDKYFRFNDLEEAAATSHDGAGMHGYLVISKKFLSKDEKTFDAHYVFQHGDHTGGTLDYTCQRE